METIDDIVREMRERAASDDAGQFEAHKFPMLADRIEKACSSMEAEKARIIAELNEVRELNRKCCDENERLKYYDQEKDRLIEKLKSHLSTAIKALSPKCVDCADVCDTCGCRHSAWIPFAKLLIEGEDYDENDYESLPLVRMTVNRTEIKNLKDENARLKAALQPVLKCDRYSCDCGAEYAVKCSSAVNDAQRIWKEGETK